VVRLNQSDQRYRMLEEPGIRRFMAESDSFFPPEAVDFTMAEQRAFYDRLCAHFRKPRPAGVAVEDRACPGPGGPIPIRIYRPSSEAALSWLLYLHGGGFVVGGLDSHDDICAELADQLRPRRRRGGLPAGARASLSRRLRRLLGSSDRRWATAAWGSRPIASSSPATVPAAISLRPWPCGPATSGPRSLQDRSSSIRGWAAT
jgi:hypothetical protein